MSINEVKLTGNLTRDPLVKEITTASKSIKVATFTIANSRTYRKANGEVGKETNFVLCEAWDTGAEQIEKLLKKGDPVYIDGALKEETWTDKEDKKHSRMKVRVNSFYRLFKSPKKEEVAVPVGAVAATADGEGMPF